MSKPYPSESKNETKRKKLKRNDVTEVTEHVGPGFVDSDELSRSLNEAEKAQKKLDQEKAELESQKAKFNAD